MAGTVTNKLIDAIQADDLDLLMLLLADSKLNLAECFLDKDAISKSQRYNDEALVDDTLRGQHLVEHCSFSKIPTIAAANGARNIVLFFCSSYPDEVLALRDARGSNIIHALIWGSYLGLEEQKLNIELYRQIIQCFPSIDARKKLLHWENSQKVRPLELASKLGQFDFFLEILETEGVYRFGSTSSSLDLLQHAEYDLTEYCRWSGGKRVCRSPLLDLRNATFDQLQSIASSNLARTTVIAEWIQQTLRRNFPFIFIWCLFRLTHMVLLFVPVVSGIFKSGLAYRIIREHTGLVHMYEQPDLIREKINQANRGNAELNCSYEFFQQTTSSHDQITYKVSMALSILFISFDFCDILRRLILNRKESQLVIPRSGRKVVSNGFYRACQFINCFSYILQFASSYIMGKSLHDDRLYQIFMQVLISSYFLGRTILIWTILYFVQLIPGIGIFVIGFKRMLSKMLEFAVIFLAIFISFSYTFTEILSLDCRTGNFKDNVSGFYSTFLLMLNALSLKEIDLSCQIHIRLLHILFVMVITILLVNFLVAVMTNAHAEMASHEDVIQMLHQLDVAQTIEGRISIFLRMFSPVFKPRMIKTIRPRIRK